MNTKEQKQEEKDFWDAYKFQVEQEKLRDYIKLRPLIRPKTKIRMVLIWILTYIILAFLIALTSICVFQIKDYSWLIYLLSYIALGFLFLKKICIKSIECYQHYAKEETRRRCVCVPSCSEYSIAVLKKYNTFKALNKIRIRLFKTCGGYGYVQDDP